VLSKKVQVLVFYPLSCISVYWLPTLWLYTRNLLSY